MPEEDKDKQKNIEDLPLRRPTSFAKAYATTKIGATHALSDIKDWAKSYQDEIDSATKAGQEEQEDKNLWGKLATWGTTLGCLAVTGGTGMGGCVALGTAMGGATRYAIDKGNDWEDAIPQAVEDLDVKYYRDKVPEIAEEINMQAENLQDWNDNMWKADLMAQLGDSWNAYKMGSMGIKMSKAGIFGEGAKEHFADAPGRLPSMAKDPLVTDITTNVDESVKPMLDEIISGGK